MDCAGNVYFFPNRSRLASLSPTFIATSPPPSVSERKTGSLPNHNEFKAGPYVLVFDERCRKTSRKNSTG